MPASYLGQHFLKSRAVILKMLEFAEIDEKDVVLEAGPGQGILTEALLHRAKKVIAVEKDARLVRFLEEKFRGEIEAEKLVLLRGDILMFDSSSYNLQITSYKLVSNIPYYLTGNFLRKFLGAELQPKSITLLVQKEVAERVVAKGGKESLLSVSVKAYGKPHYVQTVSRKFFSPPPKVDSAILHIGSISGQLFSDMPESIFFKFVRAGFSKKRKLLSNSLKTVVENPKELLYKAGLKDSVRPEELSVEDWTRIVKLF